jgi:RHS repeat-associated protein
LGTAHCLRKPSTNAVPRHQRSHLAEQSTADGRHITWDYAPGTHRPLTQTTRRADGSPITQLAQTPRFHAIVTDPAGTPTELVTPGGDIAWQHRTAVWGTPLPAPPDAAHCPLRYPGQYADPETGLHYNFHRYYDPETSRYLAPDPLGLTPAADPSGYVHNPHTWSDPLGLAPKCPEARAKSATDKIIERAQEGKMRKDSNYHPHFGDDRVMEILREPDAVYLSEGGRGNLIFRKGEDIVVTKGPGAGAGDVITGYGPSGVKGETGAKALGGSPTDPGNPVTHDDIVNGRVPDTRGGHQANSMRRHRWRRSRSATP